MNSRALPLRAAVLLAPVMLAACGQTGPLYLPPSMAGQAPPMTVWGQNPVPGQTYGTGYPAAYPGSTNVSPDAGILRNQRESQMAPESNNPGTNTTTLPQSGTR